MKDVRWVERRDIPALRKLHAAMGFAYDLPDVRNKNVIARFVAVDQGKVVAAVVGRRTTEAYFLLDAEWADPARRYAAFLELHNRALDVGAMLGYEDTNAFLPPEVERSFGRRLLNLGWRTYEDGQEWRCYTRDLAG